MNIRVNGQEIRTSEGTLADLLKSLGYGETFAAVALNMECIPKSKYGATRIREKDEIEIVAPMAGG